jgi:HSP20 family molecular chaperone IbpA
MNTVEHRGIQVQNNILKIDPAIQVGDFPHRFPSAPTRITINPDPMTINWPVIERATTASSRLVLTVPNAWHRRPSVTSFANDLTLATDLPGVRPEDCSLTILGRRLHVKATRADGLPCALPELYYLGPEFDVRSAEATLDSGVLVVRFLVSNPEDGFIQVPVVGLTQPH